MRKEFYRKVRKYNNAYKRRKLWHKIVMFLSGIVVFCTTYALILPAITLDRDNHTYDENGLIASESISYAIQPYTVTRKIYNNSYCYFS